MAYNPIKVANRFIALARSEDVRLDQMQVLKLTYIAHGWSLALLDRALVNETAEAWKYGPVIPAVYFRSRIYRGGPVTADLEGDWDGPKELQPEDEQLVRLVWDGYKHLKGLELSAITHRAGTPWSQAWGTRQRNAPIPDEIIKAHYKDLFARQQKAPAAA